MVVAEPVVGLGAADRGVCPCICLCGKGLVVCWWVWEQVAAAEPHKDLVSLWAELRG